jgi:hypothetical protein
MNLSKHSEDKELLSVANAKDNTQYIEFNERVKSEYIHEKKHGL